MPSNFEKAFTHKWLRIPSQIVKTRPFVHLHLHTGYSLLDGATRIPDIMDYALETGMPMVIMEEVTVIKPRSRSRRRRSEEPEAGTLLDIRFNMSGYLRMPG